MSQFVTELLTVEPPDIITLTLRIFSSRNAKRGNERKKNCVTRKHNAAMYFE